MWILRLSELCPGAAGGEIIEELDIVKKAAELRSRGICAARAGRFEEAQAVFLECLGHDPNNASTLLWLAGTAPSPREAYQFLDRARRIDPGHPLLARAAAGIHEYFAKRQARRPPPGREAAPIYRRPSLDERGELGDRGARRRAIGGLSRAANTFLSLIWRLLSVALLVVALVFLVALAMDLGRQGDLRALPSAVPRAAGFTGNYLKSLSGGDLGIIGSEYHTLAGTPVASELRRALPLSLGLLAAAVGLAALVGLTLGVGAALGRARRFSGVLLFGSVLGISTPSFFAAMLLIWLGVWLYRITGTHLFPISGFGWDAHLILPALVLAGRPAATVTRLSCNAVVEVLEADYVRTAVAKGLRFRLVLVRHVLRNAGVPLLTAMGVSLRFSLAVLPIVEYIFNWPGIGRVLLAAMQIQDTTTVVGMTLPLVLLFVLVNLLLEVVYPVIDPRLRGSEVGVV